ncbi:MULTISPECIES: hypothetical protein [unclassified Leptolyngbya]|uniref:hypothetical protein n=1 Tax=unclassified Leptolyngbya TaxID=2650499 RepID=UPI001685AACB|nr:MULTISPECIES: hypothetical protein [unclassified Leptolyngbya]MBD1912069.1 hypothetical protein [Leptolyngbya sp. FACHB-8]MBD2153789.1 hypothetical protein [Leptolyngbya sp. FACHB-16]
MTRQREKVCDRCQNSAPVLYRAQIDDTERWVFICDACYSDVSQNNPHYIYGGTWKAQKKK